MPCNYCYNEGIFCVDFWFPNDVAIVITTFRICKYNFSFTIATQIGDKVTSLVRGGEEIMSQKAHGTSAKPVQKDLRWGCDYETADRVCNFNRHYAEPSGYWKTTKFFSEVSKTEPTEYYDAVTGKLLFTAPNGRSMDDYLKESTSHGWPSFRDQEVNWDCVRVLDDGECVSSTGTHLGHNIPDSKGNR